MNTKKLNKFLTRKSNGEYITKMRDEMQFNVSKNVVIGKLISLAVKEHKKGTQLENPDNKTTRNIDVNRTDVPEEDWIYINDFIKNISFRVSYNSILDFFLSLGIQEHIKLSKRED